MTNNRTTVLVTGAFGGIGEAVCRKLSLQGVVVLRVGRRLPGGNAQPLPGPGPSVDIGANLASAGGWEDVRRSAESAGLEIGALIHCAGTLIPCDIGTALEADLRKMLDDNILSLMLACTTMVPAMRARQSGRIVILGSLGGLVPMPHAAVYAATKFAVRGFALSLAEELRGSGVAVSLINCGPVHTPMLQRESRLSGSVAFVTRALSPDRAAEMVLDVLGNARRETLAPRLSGWISLMLGASSWLFELGYPMLSALGQIRKKRYTAAHPAVVNIRGGQS